MKNTAKTAFIAFTLLIVFLVFTFPFERLGPKVKGFIERGLRRGLNVTANCELNRFSLSFPIGFAWDHLQCIDFSNQKIIDLTDGNLSLFPGSQTLSGKIGNGHIKINANSGMKSPPTRIEAEFKQVPFERLVPLLSTIGNRFNPNVPKQLKLEGLLNGKLDMPLQNFEKEKGAVDLNFSGLRIPQQPLLDLIGLKEVSFSKATVKTDLAAGKMNLLDVAFLSDQLSGKVDGTIQFPNNNQPPMPAVNLKWKIQKSDALMSAPLGQALSQAPCPSPDAEGFCTRRVSRMNEFNGLF